MLIHKTYNTLIGGTERYKQKKIPREKRNKKGRE